MNEKYEVKYGVYNIRVARIFPEYRITLERIVARIGNWEQAVDFAKRDILREAQERFGLKKQVRHYKKEVV